MWNNIPLSVSQFGCFSKIGMKAWWAPPLWSGTIHLTWKGLLTSKEFLECSFMKHFYMSVYITIQESNLAFYFYFLLFKPCLFTMPCEMYHLLSPGIVTYKRICSLGVANDHHSLGGHVWIYIWGTLRVVTARQLVVLSGSFTSHSKSVRRQTAPPFMWSCEPREIHSL